MLCTKKNVVLLDVLFFLCLHLTTRASVVTLTTIPLLVVFFSTARSVVERTLEVQPMLKLPSCTAFLLGNVVPPFPRHTNKG